MHLATYYSHERRLWWYAVNGEAGEPIIVSPAVFGAEEDAAAAGLQQMGILARVVERVTGVNPLA